MGFDHLLKDCGAIDRKGVNGMWLRCLYPSFPASSKIKQGQGIVDNSSSSHSEILNSDVAFPF